MAIPHGANAASSDVVIDLRHEMPIVEVGSRSVPFLDLARLHSTIEAEIVNAWTELLRSASFIGGRPVRQFEEDLAQYLGVAEVVGVANGTDAIVIALRAMGLMPGDEVIAPANTFVATVEAIIHAGGTPVLVDVDPYTATIDPVLMEAAITSKTRFVIPVHLFGQSADMDALQKVCERHGLLIVEDNAQALGAAYRGRKVGSMGHASTMSFYPGKNLGAAGDGGAIAFHDVEVAAKARAIANHGRGDHGEHTYLGYNSRLDTVQAAVLSIKLGHLDEWNRVRADRARLYNEMLGDSPLQLPYARPDGQHIFHLYVVLHSDRDHLAEQLAARGIGTGVHYRRPVHLNSPYAHLGTGPGSFPVSEAWARRQLSLPMGPTLTEGDVEWVARSIREVVEVSGAYSDSSV